MDNYSNQRFKGEITANYLYRSNSTNQCLKNKIGPSSINTNTSPPQEFSEIGKATRKGINYIISVAEKTANFGKENFVNPYLNNHLNTLNLALGRSIERDFELAKNEGGLIFSRPFGVSWITNYPRTWISNTIRYTTPKYIQKRIHQRTVKNHDFLIYPFKLIRRGLEKIPRKFAKSSSNPQEHRKYLQKMILKKQARLKAIDSNVNYFSYLVNRKIKLKKLPESRFAA